MQPRMGYGHYMLAVDRRVDGARDYDLCGWNYSGLGQMPTPVILPPPTPLWHWAVW